MTLCVTALRQLHAFLVLSLSSSSTSSPSSPSPSSLRAAHAPGSINARTGCVAWAESHQDTLATLHEGLVHTRLGAEDKWLSASTEQAGSGGGDLGSDSPLLARLIRWSGDVSLEAYEQRAGLQRLGRVLARICALVTRLVSEESSLLAGRSSALALWVLAHCGCWVGRLDRHLSSDTSLSDLTNASTACVDLLEHVSAWVTSGGVDTRLGALRVVASLLDLPRGGEGSEKQSQRQEEWWQGLMSWGLWNRTGVKQILKRLNASVVDMSVPLSLSLSFSHIYTYTIRFSLDVI